MNKETVIWQVDEYSIVYGEPEKAYYFRYTENNACRKGCCQNSDCEVGFMREEVERFIPILQAHLAKGEQ